MRPSSGLSAPRVRQALVAALMATPGCAGQAEPPAEALQRHFPEQAAAILEPADDAVVVVEGRDGARLESTRLGLALELPGDAAGPMRLRTDEGFEVRVRELGAGGAVEPAGRAVAYRRAGGSSFWTVAPHGIEEWLLLEPGAARAEGVAASWEIEGAALERRGEGVALLDEQGEPRLLVRAPKAYAKDGRQVAVHLDVLEGRLALSVDAGDAGEDAVLVDPSWTAAANSLTPGRRLHAAALLPSGNVLVAGGETSAGPSISARTYDPATKLWTNAASMALNRQYHTASPLVSGRVLVAGGYSTSAHPDVSNNVTGNAQLYDELTNTWTTTGQMSPRYIHTATLLANGRVLVAGGKLFNPSTVIQTAQIFDPESGVWLPAANMNEARYGHAATLLADGRVLVVGGINQSSTYMNSVEIYDPDSDAWSSGAPMSASRAYHTLTLLVDERVLVVGGEASSGSYQENMELYKSAPSPGIGEWRSAAQQTGTARAYHTATILNGGAVLIAGGTNASAPTINSQVVFDPISESWLSGPTINLSNARYVHTATRLTDGSVLVAGGRNSATSYLTSAEVYSVDLNGSSCSSNITCQSGSCVDGVCCNSACNGGCGVCSTAAGAPVNGTCSPRPVGTACRDPVGPCDVAEACDGVSAACPADGLAAPGVPCRPSADDCDAEETCTGSSATCPADALQPVGLVCRAATGPCDAEEACTGSAAACPPDAQQPNGASCDDADACTQADSCQSGACTGAPVVCPGPDQCHLAGACDPATGACSNPNKLNGTACNDADACTQADSCQSGACTGAPVVCTALDPCHSAGGCDPATGVCSNPNKSNDTPCDDADGCTPASTCQAGVCTGNPKVCVPQGACYDAGTCDPTTGQCSNPVSPPGTTCPGGACLAGVCLFDIGHTCDAATQCASQSCVDGVCCGTSCPGQCMACSAAKKGAGPSGTCGPIAAGIDPDDDCHAALFGCGNTGSCDGAGACQKKAAGTVCGQASCNESTLNVADTCDGQGACVDNGIEDCGQYLCEAVACTTSCSLDADCADTAYCKGTKCVAKKPVGEACVLIEECLSAACIAGVCRNDADKDGVPDEEDNCPEEPNTSQTNTDGAQGGDACDTDDDDDGYSDVMDNCPLLDNPDQLDQNMDGIGDACDCDNPPKPDGAPCSDNDACTLTDTCQNGECTPGNSVECDQPPSLECKLRACQPQSGSCDLFNKQEDAPCPGGVCKAGGCFVDPAPTGSTSSSSGVGGGPGAGGTGGEGGLGGTGAAGGAGGAGAGASTGSGASSGGEADTALRMHGNGCAPSCALGDGGSSRGAAWLLLGLLLAARRRSEAPRTPAQTRTMNRRNP